ncbi:MAG: Rieske 2Fe-2S domain-containing protein, partial [Sphingomonadales bacterium]|nr:Rieske 2Fe-2S domain-containing protein [Sphingomonadales bacterium]
RGSVEDRDFTAFYMRDGRVQAAFGLNRGEEVMLAKELIAGRAEVDISALQNDELDFHDIVFGEEEAAGGPEDDAGQAEGDFQFAARSGQVREGTVRRFAVGGLEVAIARYGDQIYALHNLCTHLACHLASGKVEDGGLVCLCHGSIFELTTGIPINPPATRPVKTYPVREVDGRILVNVSA